MTHSTHALTAKTTQRQIQAILALAIWIAPGCADEDIDIDDNNINVKSIDQEIGNDCATSPLGCDPCYEPESVAALLLAASADGVAFGQPQGLLLSQQLAIYDAATGGFQITTTYHPDHYLIRSDIAGTVDLTGVGGTAHYDVIDSDSAGVISRREIIESFAQCDVVRYTRDAIADGPWMYHEGSLRRGRYEYLEQRPAPRGDTPDLDLVFVEGTVDVYRGHRVELSEYVAIDAAELYTYTRFSDADGNVDVGWSRRGPTVIQRGSARSALGEHSRENLSTEYELDTGILHAESELEIDHRGVGAGETVYQVRGYDGGDESWSCTASFEPGTCIEHCGDVAQACGAWLVN